MKTYNNQPEPTNTSCSICGKKVKSGRATFAITNGTEHFNFSSLKFGDVALPEGFYKTRIGDNCAMKLEWYSF